MKIAVWSTGHEIADTVAHAVHHGLCSYSNCNSGAEEARFYRTDRPMEGLEWGDIHIGYGILRQMDDVFRAATRDNKPWVQLDKGYFKPGHYDGYYRISLNGTQQTTGLDNLEPDYERWDRLGIEILPSKGNLGYRLLCPPTNAVKDFFGCDFNPRLYGNELLRMKGVETLLQHDLDRSDEVVTFNSSVGWEALRQGISVTSDPQHSIVGAYQKMVDKDISQSYEDRRRLFGVMAGLQLRLDEIRSGSLWPLIKKLLVLR